MEKIDIVLPVYNEGPFIYENIITIKNVLDKDKIPHRFIAVNDGSKDETWLELKRLSKDIENFTALSFSRNFSKESAVAAGMMEVQADYCLIMDSDLQHPPEMIPKMLKTMEEDKSIDVVECIKEDRGEESFFYKISAKSFYYIINKLSGFELDNSSDFRLINKRVLEAWKEVGDTHLFIRGMLDWVGFKKVQIPFNVNERAGGESKFSTMHLFKMALDAITSFSSAPLYFTHIVSALFMLGAIIMGIQTLYMKFSGIAADGFTTVILLILILGSVILFSLGLIGTYISKIYDEVKHRPRYIIRDRIDSKSKK